MSTKKPSSNTMAQRDAFAEQVGARVPNPKPPETVAQASVRIKTQSVQNGNLLIPATTRRSK